MIGRTNRLGRLRKRLRQGLLVLLSAAYVLVGFGGEITCAGESLVIPFAAASESLASDKADTDTKKASPTVVDHCYSCAPVTMPAAPVVRAPAALSGAVSFRCSTILALEARLLDTPPPKSQI